MGLKERLYPESRFGGFTDVDGTLAFYQRVQALLAPSSRVLEVGCGRGAFKDDPVTLRRELRIFKGRCARVTGIDVDPAAGSNPFLDEFRLIEGARWPVEDGSAELVLVDYVLEHVSDPPAFFNEVHRALTQTGALCLRTSNAWSYVGVLSRLVPNRLHTRVLVHAKDRLDERDIFSTYYRCNSVWAIRRALRAAGFEGVAYGFGAEPGYLSFSRLAYTLGVLYQRWAPRSLQPGIHVFARKV